MHIFSRNECIYKRYSRKTKSMHFMIKDVKKFGKKLAI